jgi:uncharacterized protein
VVDFDPAKDAKNIRKHGISLTRFADMTGHMFVEDERFDYGERRFLVFGAIDGRLHVAVLTYRGQDERIISLRRANQKEQKAYGKATA